MRGGTVWNALRACGEGSLLDLQAGLAAAGVWDDLRTSTVEEVLDALWPDLTRLVDGTVGIRF